MLEMRIHFLLGWISRCQDILILHSTCDHPTQFPCPGSFTPEPKVQCEEIWPLHQLRPEEELVVSCQSGVIVGECLRGVRRGIVVGGRACLWRSIVGTHCEDLDWQRSLVW